MKTGIILSVGLAILGLTIMWSRKASATVAKPPAAPKPAAPKPAAPKAALPMPILQPSPLRFSSLISDVEEKYGRATLSTGAQFTLAPLWDAENDTWARLSYADGLIALSKLGLRYPTFEELDEIANRPDTLILKPVTLVNSAKDGALMGTKEFWDKHDLAVQAQLDAAGWNGNYPATSIGKHWAFGAPPDKSWLHGWYIPKSSQPGSGYSKIIQNRGKTFHDRNHIDYSSTLIGVAL